MPCESGTAASSQPKTFQEELDSEERRQPRAAQDSCDRPLPLRPTVKRLRHPYERFISAGSPAGTTMGECVGSGNSSDARAETALFLICLNYQNR